MDKNKLQEMAELAFNNIKKHKTLLFDATEDRLALEQSLLQSISSAYSEGKIDGKNETIRKAQEKELFADGFDKLAQAEFTERTAKHAYDQAAFDVEVVKTLLRIAELPE